MDQGFNHGECADLMLAMGSSLRVNPAASMCTAAGIRPGSNLVIVNLQKTPLDHYATLCIHAKIDDVIDMLFKELNMQIPTFNLKRLAQVTLTKSNTGKQTISFNGITEYGGAYDIFKKISINGKLGASLALSEPEM